MRSALLLLPLASALQPFRSTGTGLKPRAAATRLHAAASDADVAVVTHAAGRMGASLCAQLHESWEREGTPNWAQHEKLVIRAVAVSYTHLRAHET